MASTKVSSEIQEVINQLNKQWVWVPDWKDSSDSNTAGRIVHFTRDFELPARPTTALLQLSADTKYKLFVNGVRAAVGPSKGGPAIWYYDSHDIAKHLHQGRNEIHFAVIRYFAQNRAAMPFERTLYPGLTLCGRVICEEHCVDLSSTSEGWTAEVDFSREFPTGLIDDGFLYISERVARSKSPSEPVTPQPYKFNTKNGDLLPWRLRPRIIPMPEENELHMSTVRASSSYQPGSEWANTFLGHKTLDLGANSTHSLELQADVHSTAFVGWSLKSAKPSQVHLKVLYSEGYENEPRSYPFFRSKEDRLDAANAHIVGPYDDATIELPAGETVYYEPFWFRTFRLVKIDIQTGPGPVELMGMQASQTNYPLAVKAA